MMFNKIYRRLDDFITNDLRLLTTSKPFSYFQLELEHDRFSISNFAIAFGIWDEIIIYFPL